MGLPAALPSLLTASRPHTPSPQPPSLAHSALGHQQARPLGVQRQRGRWGLLCFLSPGAQGNGPKSFRETPESSRGALGSSARPVFWAHFACSALPPPRHCCLPHFSALSACRLRNPGPQCAPASDLRVSRIPSRARPFSISVGLCF